MSFLRKLFGGREGTEGVPDRGPDETADVLWIYVACEKCGERVRVRVNKASDLSDAADTSDEITDEGPEDAPPSGYILRKEVLGNDCPRLLHVHGTFDGRRRLLEMTVQGGHLITRDEYEASQPAP